MRQRREEAAEKYKPRFKGEKMDSSELERRKREEAERNAALFEIAVKQRQREREIEEKMRQRREEAPGNYMAMFKQEKMDGSELERRKRDEAEQKAKLDEIAEKQRQREREVEEKMRQRREEAPGKYKPFFKQEKMDGSEVERRKQEEAERNAVPFEILVKQRQREREIEEKVRQERRGFPEIPRCVAKAWEPSTMGPPAADGRIIPPAAASHVPKFRQDTMDGAEKVPPPETDRWGGRNGMDDRPSKIWHDERKPTVGSSSTSCVIL